MTHIPKIIIKTIDPANQRFGECGDWFLDAEDDTLTVFINRMDDWRSELAVAIHELYEAVAFMAKDGDQTDVDAFDKKFYADEKDGEAGDSPEAPYYSEHKDASFIELDVIQKLGLSWQQHEMNCE